MMKNIISNVFIILVSILFFYGCKEDSLDTFSNELNGSSIYFYYPYATANQTTPTTQLKYSFAFEAQDLNEKTIDIPVRITGSPQPYDREFKIVFNPSSTLKEGTNFKISNAKLIIPADSIKSNISVTVYRTDALESEPLELRMRLVASDDFNTYIRTQSNVAKTKETSVIDFALSVDDIYGAPYAWLQYSTRFEPALGTYSKEKFNLLLEIFDLEVELFTDPTVVANTAFSAATMSYWKSYFKYWLAKEKEAGRIYYDGSGDEIKIP